jgi:hypothetical protein
MTRAMFDHWISQGGKLRLRDTLRNTRLRWFFGGYRARQALYKAASTTFRPRGTFSEALRKRANDLPAVVRSCALAIRRGSFGHLSTFNSDMAVCVVPRSIVQNDFKVHMLRHLATLPQTQGFQGLTEQVIMSAALDAEAALFSELERRTPLVDETGHGLIVEVDPQFPWKLGGSDGHYYYAWSGEERTDLTNRKDRRHFLAAINEMMVGQRVYLKRMAPGDVADLRATIDLRRLAGVNRPREHSALVKVRIIQDAEEPVFSETV